MTHAVNRKLIGGNFKMNKSNSDLKNYFYEFRKNYIQDTNIEVMIAPQTASLSYANQFCDIENLSLWAQNCRYENSGAFTWESSLSLLREIWVKYVIVGHGERRNIFWENDEIVNKKLLAIINGWMRPILCVWENLEQKNNWQTEETLEEQLKSDLASVADLSLVDVAYEPIWSIWTWLTPTNEEIEKMHGFIRKFVSPVSKILYWWSSNENNAWEFIKIPNVDGFLVGGASLDPNRFLKMIDAMK